jgi:tRNA pseudouridine55 synthase
VVLPARPVTVHRFTVLASRDAVAGGHAVRDLDVEVEVSSGTYVRALARDLGDALGVGGHLTALRRTRVGRFDLAAASTMAQLQAARDTGDGVPLVPLADAARASFTARELTAAEATAVGYGQRIPSVAPLRSEPVAAFAPDGALVAMLDERGTLAKAHVVFAPSGS